MKKVAVILAKGFEEIEAVTPIDVLRRAGVEVTLFGIGSISIKGARGIEIVCDKQIEDLNNSLDAIVLPGGMPGAKNISENPTAIKAVTNYLSNNKIVGAICASPGVILGSKNLLKGRSFTCYPGFEDGVEGNFSIDSVVVDGNLITSRGPGTALEFSYRLVDLLVSKEISNKLKKGMLYSD